MSIDASAFQDDWTGSGGDVGVLQAICGRSQSPSPTPARAPHRYRGEGAYRLLVYPSEDIWGFHRWRFVRTSDRWIRVLGSRHNFEFTATSSRPTSRPGSMLPWDRRLALHVSGVRPALGSSLGVGMLWTSAYGVSRSFNVATCRAS